MPRPQQVGVLVDDPQHVPVVSIDVRAGQRSRLEDDGGERGRRQVDRSRGDEPAPQVAVLGRLEVGREPVPPEDVPPHQDGRCRDPARHPEDVRPDRRPGPIDDVVDRVGRGRPRFAGLFGVPPGGGQPDLRVAVEEVELAFELVRLPVVVRVQKRDHVSACPLDPVVAGGRGPAVGLAEEGHPVPVPGQGGGEVGTVRAAVVDDEHLGRLPGLTEGALDRPVDGPDRLVRRDDHADGQRAHEELLSAAHGRVG